MQSQITERTIQSQWNEGNTDTVGSAHETTCRLTPRKSQLKLHGIIGTSHLRVYREKQGISGRQIDRGGMEYTEKKAMKVDAHGKR